MLPLNYVFMYWLLSQLPKFISIAYLLTIEFVLDLQLSINVNYSHRLADYIYLDLYAALRLLPTSSGSWQ